MSTLISNITIPFSQKLKFCHHFQSQHTLTTKTHKPFLKLSPKPKPFRCFSSSVSEASVPSNEESSWSVIHFEDVVEKDWSFLEPQDSRSEDYVQKFDRIISAGEVKESCKVVVSMGAEAFVDRLVGLMMRPLKMLLVVHDSLLVLALLKEKYDDKVKCWQGGIVDVPEKWAPVDVVFLYFLPGLPFELDRIIAAVGERCSPGARVVISHPQGRQMLEQQRKQYPDIVVSDLPDKVALEKVAAEHSFSLSEFVDEPDFYLAVLKFSAAKN